MKKALILSLFALTLFASAPKAQAGVLYTCQLRGEMSGIRFGIFWWGGQIIGGNGAIRCVDEFGNRVQTLPVRIGIVGGGFVPSWIDANYVESLKVVSAGVAGVPSPYYLTGSYAVGATGGATVLAWGGSVNATLGIKNEATGVSFDLGLVGERAYGFGVRVHGLMFIVEPLAQYRY